MLYIYINEKCDIVRSSNNLRSQIPIHLLKISLEAIEHNIILQIVFICTLILSKGFTNMHQYIHMFHGSEERYCLLCCNTQIVTRKHIIYNK